MHPAAGPHGRAGADGAIGVDIAEHHIGNAGDSRDFRMNYGHRTVDRFLDDHAGMDEGGRIGLFDLQADLADIDERVEDAAIAEVELDPAPLRCVEPDIQLMHEGRHHGQPHFFAAAAAAGRSGAHEAGGSIPASRCYP